MYFIGIDGGGSATRAVVINERREVLGRGEAGPSSHYAVGPAAAATSCRNAAVEAIKNARDLHAEFNPAEISAWGFGLAGVRREADQELMTAFLQEICDVPFALETDVVAAHAGAFAGDPGIVVSAGTGAVTLGADEYGEQFYADGWGPLLGDEGGGYWIGVEALRAICRSLDGRSHPTALTEPVFKMLGVAEGGELVQFIYSEECTRNDIARIAEIVFEQAETGVAEAVEIRARAAALMARGVRSVARALLQRRRERALENDEQDAQPLDMLLALRGGLFEDDFMRATLGFAATEAMVELKRDYLPIGSWRVVKPQYDAAVGAAILGQLLAWN